MLSCSKLAESEEGPHVPPPGSLPKRAPKLFEDICYVIEIHQDCTHQELISHISPFNIHIYLIHRIN